MPMVLRIIDLPHDILVAIFELLLDEIDSSFRSQVEKNQPYPPHLTPPHDLLHCRLVCRLFCDLSSPLAWREVELFVDGTRYPWAFPQFSHSILVPPSIVNSDSALLLRGILKAAFLAQNPKIASHIKMIYVANWIDRPQEARDLFAQYLVSCFRAMHKVQEVIFGMFHGDCAEALEELLRQPRLHTVDVCSMQGLTPLHFDSPLTSIKHLKIEDPSSLSCLPLYMPNLESLTLREEFIRDHWNSHEQLEIPWHTLCNLSISGDASWERAYHSAKKVKFPHSYPLVTLQIVARTILNDELCHVFEALDGRQLRNLTLEEIHDLDLPLLGSIGAAFPHLNHFHIRSATTLETWSPGFMPSLSALCQLQELRSLCWNCVEHPTGSQPLENLVPKVAGGWLTLHRVTWLYSLGSGTERKENFEITRDDEGQYKGTYRNMPW